MDNDRFARTIKNARLKKGYTQSQLADLLNVSNKTISGKQEFPKQKDIKE
jgi:transcriptional regulator with XRE-family HTH domain